MNKQTKKLLKEATTPNAIVLGSRSNTGLSIIRSLGRKKISTISIDIATRGIGTYSKHCSSFEIVKNFSKLLEFLLEAANLNSIKNVLFCENDASILFLEKHQIVLKDKYRFSWQNKTPYSKIIDKHSMLNLAKTARIPIPQTFFSGTATISKIKNQIIFPSIVKPCKTQSRYRYKGIIVNNNNELSVALKNERFHEGFIIQEIIPGNDEEIHICAGYCDQDSNIKAIVTGQKYRQIPKNFGATTIAKIKNNAKIIEYAKIFLSSIGYTGCFDFEMKRRKDTDDFYFIEINPRICFWNELVISAGVNLPHIEYLFLTQKESDLQLTKKLKQVTWISIFDDLIACLKYYIKDDKLVLFNWIIRIFSSQSYAVLSLTDIKPFFFKAFSYFYKRTRKI